MTEQELIWDEYYKELDPERRKALLDQDGGTALEDPLNKLRKYLWELRYVDPANKTHRVDFFLLQCTNFLFLYKSTNWKFAQKSAAQEVRSAVSKMGFSQASQYGGAGENLLYMEFRNTISRYFSTCSNHYYGRKLFGIMSSSDSEKKNQMAKDAWQLSEGLPERLEMTEDLALFSKAVHDEYFAQTRDAKEYWQKYKLAGS